MGHLASFNTSERHVPLVVPKSQALLSLSSQGLIKAKLAKLKRELLEGDGAGKGGGGGGRGFDVSKSGDTRVGFVGFPR
jgi:ribosome-interacting GTPase 1